jgi:hypothetical protein
MRRSAFVLAALAVLAAAATSAGCDLLFPEFSSHVDAGIDDAGAIPDGGAAPHVSGALCALGDLRDFRSCATGHGGGFRITVEETRDVTTADAHGNFTLPLARPLDVATLAAIDPSGGAAPTIVTLVLHGAPADGVGVPVASAQALEQVAALTGFSLDPTRGAVLAWTVDSKGAPVAGASAATANAVGVGPLYEGAAANELEFGGATGARGVVAWLNVPAAKVALTVSPPANGAVKGDQFTLPIRPGAVTITTLFLPPR